MRDPLQCPPIFHLFLGVPDRRALRNLEANSKNREINMSNRTARIVAVSCCLLAAVMISGQAHAQYMRFLGGLCAVERDWEICA
jgi:hypothetical protein